MRALYLIGSTLLLAVVSNTSFAAAVNVYDFQPNWGFPDTSLATTQAIAQIQAREGYFENAANNTNGGGVLAGAGIAGITGLPVTARNNVRANVRNNIPNNGVQNINVLP